MTVPNRVAACLAISLLFGAGSAAAQVEDQAAARSLFNEGRQLLKAGKYPEACRKLEAASGFYKSAGILLNLADCYEKLGRTASAWTEFGEAATVAERANRTAEAREASTRQSALEPKLGKLTILVGRELPGLTVKRDGAEVPAAALGTPIPVDPGAHEIRVEAAGHEPWSITVTIGPKGQTVPVEVPELRATPEAPAAAQPAPAPGPGPGPSQASAFADARPTERRSTVLEWVMVGGGAALAIAGAAVMLVEVGNANDARNNHDQAAYDATKTPWALGLAGVGVGAAVTATGLVLAVLSSQGAQGAARTGVQAAPWVASQGGGVLLSGGW